MRSRSLPQLALFGLLAALPAAPAAAEVRPHAGMLRYPDVGPTHIAFRYANDLWLVPREGGTATPVASPAGQESLPKFSPDGERLAFMGNYDGNVDLYTIPVAGGSPLRVTHHPVTEVLTDWTPDGRLIFYARGMQEYPRAQELFTVAAEGGLPVKMPVPYGANGSVAADGRSLAYTPHSRDHRTWKRYRGGMATDVWLFDLEERTSRKLTDWEGTDTLPMWHGRRVYYLSDAGPSHKLNIRVIDLDSGEDRQVTDFADHDVKWPSIGPGDRGQGEIVFQHGAELMLLDLESEEARPVRVTIPGDRPRLRTHRVEAADLVFNRQISATGKRAVVEARGDVWTLPAEKGSPRNLTRTAGAAERDPAWSPDGRWVAYFSDATGAYEVWVTRADGRGETRRLTDEGRAYLYAPSWSPDSARIAFWDKAGALLVHDLGAATTEEIDRDPGGGGGRLAWSADSRWLVYQRSSSVVEPTALWLYDARAGEARQVTAGMFNDTWPVFDREGKYLYFASQREISEPVYEDLGTTWVYTDTDRLYVLPLRGSEPSPLAPKSDEEETEEKEAAKDEGAEAAKAGAGKAKKKKKDSEDADAEGEKKEPPPVEIDLPDFERRAVPLPVERGNFTQLAVNDEGKLVYLRWPPRGGDDKASIRLLDLDDEDEPEKTVLEEADGFAISADGKKLLVTRDETMAIVDARPDQKMESPIATDGLVALVDPREEWRQVFHEAWRLERDFFYDPNLHGVDWEAVRGRYAAMLDDCVSRDDVGYVIAEMISELNVGHTYYRDGATGEEGPSVSVGMLGCDFEVGDGAYRIGRIYEGGPWDADARGPLSQPAVDVEPGDYLLEVNGAPIDPAKDPWAAFQGLAGKTVTLTVSEAPVVDERARYPVVELLAEEDDLRFRAWVEKNRRHVAEASDGRVGYIYVPNTGISGQNELVRQFFGQVRREALIIDERWNGGGQVPTRFIELLNRPVANYWALRDLEDLPWPPDAHHGPKCMLINGLAGSGGDYLPFWFRAAGLGKLVGTRTWGGLVGIGGTPRLIDGARVTVPNFAFYETDGTWGIEGHGVEPDIEVVDDPALMAGGADPQLDAAIRHMLEELETRPYRPPPRPAYPDRSGMGLSPEDH